MAESMLSAVLLSASIPDPRRNPVYYRTGDVLNIREAVRALVEEVLPHGRLVFGGHPAISPYVRSAAHALGAADRVRIYQSRFFEELMPAEHRELADLVWVDAVEGDREGSLDAMRRAMIDDDAIVAGVFVGGMEGVEEEHRLFRERHPDKPAYPIPTTGAAARRLFSPDDFDPDLALELEQDVVYELLFERLLRTALHTG